MAYVHYSRACTSLPLPQTPPQQISLIIPLTTDTIFLLCSNPSRYRIYKIRSNQILHQGSLPNNYSPSQYIQAMNTFPLQCVILVNSEHVVCRIRYRDELVEMHRMQLMGLGLDKIGVGGWGLDYRVLDSQADYLIAAVKNIADFSVSLFLYDFVSKTYSNLLNIGIGFFHCIFSNLSEELTVTRGLGTGPKSTQLMVVGEEDKKICYKLIHFEAQGHNQAQLQLLKRTQFVLKDCPKKTIAYEYCPRGVFLHQNFIFTIANSKDGLFIIQTNFLENETYRVELRANLDDEKGLIRECYGVVDGNLIFSIHSIKKRSQQLYRIAVLNLNLIDNKSPIQCCPMLSVSNSFRKGALVKNRLESIRKSLDSFSFHRYSIDLESVSQEIIKENPMFQFRLNIETIMRVRKQYFYQEMAKQMEFGASFITEILSLL